MDNRGSLVAIWALISLAAAAATGYWRWSTLAAELSQAGATAHRVTSQRAEQHDAHMTGLSALALATEPPPVDALRQVAANIMQFYPRITAIDLVDMAKSSVVMTTRQPPVAHVNEAIRVASKIGGQTPALARSGSSPGRYLLIKRVPNNAGARYALALEIDAARLASEEANIEAGTQRQLTLPDGTILRDAGTSKSDAGLFPSVSLAFSKPLGSSSQPRVLDIHRKAPVNDLCWTAAIEAVILGDGAPRHQATRKALIDAGANTQLADRGGATPLAHARSRGFLVMTKTLEARK